MDVNTMFGVMLTAFLIVVVLCVKPLGSYIANVMQVDGDRQRPPNLALRTAGRVEGLCYRLCGIHSAEEMPWTRYAIALDLPALIRFVQHAMVLQWSAGAMVADSEFEN